MDVGDYLMGFAPCRQPPFAGPAAAAAAGAFEAPGAAGAPGA